LTLYLMSTAKQKYSIKLWLR